MNLYVIRRPKGWHTPEELQAGAARSKQVGDEEASSPEKIREHAARAGIAVSDIFEVADTVIVRPDPVAAAV